MEHRLGNRTATDASASVYIGADRIDDARILNISNSGLYVHTPGANVRRFQMVEIELATAQRSGGARFAAGVVRTDRDGFGVLIDTSDRRAARALSSLRAVEFP